MLLLDATIYPMDAPAIPRGYVRVRDGKIVDVGPIQPPPKPEPGEKVVQLPGKLIVPGFIDAHCHLGLEEDSLGSEGSDANELGTPLTPHNRAIDGINPLDGYFEQARAAGITTAVISPGSTNPIGGEVCAVKTVGRWVDRMALRAPLAIKFALGENPKRAYGGKDKAPYTRMGTAALIREQLHRARQYLGAMQDSAAMGGKPPAYDAKCEALIPLLTGKIRAHIHAHRAYDMLTGVRIAQEFGFDYTLVHATEGHLVADILAELGADVICGPLVNTRTKPELSNMDGGNCAALVRAGLHVAIGTDHPEMPVDTLAMSAGLARANGLSKEEALAAITLEAAHVTGLADRIGSLTPGKDADLLVFGQDPLAVQTRPEMVMIGGRVERWRK